MEIIEFMGHNGTIRKLRGFKERTKVKIKIYRGLKCNFAKPCNKGICHGRPTTLLAAEH